MALPRIPKQFIPLFFIFPLFILLISTVPPSVYLGDCGETITCSFTLGIQHPPGYPVFSVIGKLFSFLPLGDGSFRIYLMSVCFTLLNFFLIYLATSHVFRLINLPGSGISLFTPALLYILCFTVWQQSTIAKGGIYILNITFLLLQTLALLRLYKKKNSFPSFFYLFCLIGGISFGNHLMLQVILAPAYFFILFKSGVIKNFTLKRVLFSLLFFIAGFSVYLYLPIRAKTALINWGDPSTFSSFLEVITRYQYLRSEITRSLTSSLAQSWKFLTSVSYAYAYAGVIFIFAGAYMLYKKEKNLLIYALSIPALFLLVTSVYLNLSPERLYLMETYITPVYFPLSLLAGLGIYYLSDKIKRFLPVKAMMIPVIFISAVLLLQLALFYPRLDKSRYYYVYDYNRNMLSTAEQNSIIFITGDGVVFPSWYLKYIKKFRPDLILIGSAVLPMQWVRDGILKQNPSVRLPAIKEKVGTESTGRIINAIIRMNYSRFNIYFSYNKTEKNALDSSITIMPKGLLFKVVPENYSYPTERYLAANNSLWKYYNKRGLFDWRERRPDKKTKKLYIEDYAVPLNTLGTFAEDHSLFSYSYKYFRLAHMYSPLDHEYIYNMGNSMFYMGNISGSVSYYKQSLELSPAYENAWFNLGVAYYKLKKYREALRAFKKVREINPERDDVISHIRLMEKAAR